MEKICKTIFIYRFTNLINGKVYIGSTNNIKKRYTSHKILSKDANTYFYSAIRKYGWDNFKFEIIEEGVCPLIRNDRENYWIRHHNSLDRSFGYNSMTADCNEKSAETRAKLSKAFKGKKLSEEHKKKMSEAHKGEKHWNYGKRASAETRAKLSASHKGVKLSDETRLKMSNSRKGEKSPSYGKKLSDETKAKILASRKAYFARVKEEKRKMRESRLRKLLEG